MPLPQYATEIKADIRDKVQSASLHTPLTLGKVTVRSFQFFISQDRVVEKHVLQTLRDN